MRAVVEQAALLTTAAGVLLGALVALATRRLLDGLPVLLDLLLAAGLLRLALVDSWAAIAAVALVVVVRRVVVMGIGLTTDGPPTAVPRHGGLSAVARAAPRRRAARVP